MPTILDLQNLPKNKQVLLLGLGTEIWQFLDWLIGVIKLDPKQIILADSREEIDFKDYQKSSFGGVFLGQDYLQSLQNPNIEFVFKAPGIWSLKPQLQTFRNKKGEDKVLSSLVFFIQKFQSQTIGISGTKGKSTTSSLTHFLLQKSRFKSHYCGNTTGISPYQFWTKIDQEVDLKEFFVLELSSFQLQDLGYSNTSPKYSAITNYYIDHQDQHKTVAEYWAAKDNLFKFLPEDGLVVCHQELAEKSTTLKSIQSKILLTSQISNELTSDLDFGLEGLHNQKNLSLALCLSQSIKQQTNQESLILAKILEQKSILRSYLSTYKGLPHRLELIKKTIISENFQINFYDDGYATETDAVVACVESLTKSQNQYLWLFLAGKDKGFELDNLVDKIKQEQEQIWKIEFCGEVGDKIKKLLEFENQNTKKFKDAVTDFKSNFKSQVKIFKEQIVLKKDPKKTSKIVLNIAFSPCGSSFDEFVNYTQRADFWVDTIKNLDPV
jgi:UDP-N-acetylmuramoylalanine-D-glutamate ligase